MNCEEIRIQLDPLVDEELSANERSVIMHHVKHCPACQRQLEELAKLRQNLQQVACTAIPEQLAANLIMLIDSEPQERPFKLQHRWLPQVLSHGAALIIGALIVYFGALLPPTNWPTKEEIITAHVGSLMNQQLTQVATGNPHQVKPWFAGKLDYAPPVVDLSAHGYPLIGGRIDDLDEHKVAALVYMRREHTINVFVVPVSTSIARLNMTATQNGFNLIGWQDAGFQFWAISDLSTNELQRFNQLLIAVKK